MTPEIMSTMQATFSAMTTPALDAKLHAKLYTQAEKDADSANPLVYLVCPPDDAIDRFLYKCYVNKMPDKDILRLLRETHPEWHNTVNGIGRQNWLKREGISEKAGPATNPAKEK